MRQYLGNHRTRRSLDRDSANAYLWVDPIDGGAQRRVVGVRPTAICLGEEAILEEGLVGVMRECTQAKLSKGRVGTEYREELGRVAGSDATA